MSHHLLELAAAERDANTAYQEHAASCPVCRPPSGEPADSLCDIGTGLVKARNELMDAMLKLHAFPQRTGSA